ncbi:MAG: hypothetical protein HY318_04795 [Armatimonadetes bacterium]|nr:hypothetical protein [Armatimonadota bacterium]
MQRRVLLIAFYSIALCATILSVSREEMVKPLHDMDRDRREFFRSLGRCVGVGSLGLIGGALITKKGPRQAEECFNRGICAPCSKVKGCGLPQALSYRQARRKQ